MDKILVSQEGNRQFFEILEELKELSLNSASIGNEAYKNAIGDGWHDNFDFEESVRESRKIASRINKMLEEEAYLEIIEDKKYINNLINLGDTFEVKIIYSNSDIEKETLTLTGKYKPDNDKEITLNSPLGKCIYKKQINTTNEYFVENNKITVHILNKY